jgi:hypothetical protein
MRKPMWQRPCAVISLIWLTLQLGLAAPADAPDRWWPKQTLPKTVLRTSSQLDFPAPRQALQMMVQSVAGLAAGAVNEGRSDEMVWVGNGRGDLEEWYSRLLN